ncbi:hypothetical protein G7084_00430 [Weissella coleopterorum]|uniref:Uncharacterized protein n=1 Tax=Weissella coleopterorum TaxID=2714949 RepID=A0A6G8AXZ3_9LACO|nr:hypothetical protein [Weissella coleopterorum]QIL49924.1 hypothetical protein G7084_00430 [Weissella coleopterorum]
MKSIKWIVGVFGVLAVILGGVYIYTFHLNNIEKAQVKKYRSKRTVSNPISKVECKKDMKLVEDSSIKDAKITLENITDDYFTYDSQATYDKRQAKMSESLSLSDEQNSTLFSDGRDSAGDSRIDNLGLESKYSASDIYVINNQDGSIELLSVATIKAGDQDMGLNKSNVLMTAKYDKNLGKVVDLRINQTA